MAPGGSSFIWGRYQQAVAHYWPNRAASANSGHVILTFVDDKVNQGAVRVTDSYSRGFGISIRYATDANPSAFTTTSTLREYSTGITPKICERESVKISAIMI